jgi:hypothetical protein
MAQDTTKIARDVKNPCSDRRSPRDWDKGDK